MGAPMFSKDPVGREVFKCIRCGACANVCPVYKNVGGFAYGWFISGPIGAILSPQMLGTQTARELPYASTLCGACADVCPVKIPIPTILRHLRRRVAQGDEFAAADSPCAHPCHRRACLACPGTKLALSFRNTPACQHSCPSSGAVIGSQQRPIPLSRWTKARPLPPFTAGFRGWWRRCALQHKRRIPRNDQSRYRKRSPFFGAHRSNSPLSPRPGIHEARASPNRLDTEIQPF